MARLAQECMAGTDRREMGLEHRDLQPCVGERRRRRQSADSGADDGHVDLALGLGASELGRRPAIGFGRVDAALDERADEDFRGEDRDQSPECEDPGRRSWSGAPSEDQRVGHEQDAPETGNQHIDGGKSGLADWLAKAKRQRRALSAERFKSAILTPPGKRPGADRARNS